jgi:N-acetylneuraminic acid mutarotase
MKKRLLFILLFFVICGLFAAVVSPILIMGTGENSWQTKASMSQARTGLGVAVVDGKIYAIGGYTAQDHFPFNQVGTNERYDPKADVWVILKPMPTPRTSFAIAAYEGKIYCVGGYNIVEGETISSSLSVNEVYDTVTDTWSTKSDAPFFGPAQANVVDGKMFITKSNKLYMYDHVADLWTNKTDIPHGGHGYVSAVVDSKIIFSFGYYPNGIALGRPTEIVMIYDTKTDTYSETSTPPKGYSSVGIAVATTGVYAPQRIYILGVKYELFSSNTVYDPVNGAWLTAKPLPTYRDGFGVAVVNDVIYVIGGQRTGALGLLPFKALSTNQQYIPVGYSGSVTTTEPLLNYYIIAGLALTIGIATYSYYYLKKIKRLIKTS